VPRHCLAVLPLNLLQKLQQSFLFCFPALAPPPLTHAQVLLEPVHGLLDHTDLKLLNFATGAVLTVVIFAFVLLVLADALGLFGQFGLGFSDVLLLTVQEVIMLGQGDGLEERVGLQTAALW
jgi:hypothetical protein